MFILITLKRCDLHADARWTRTLYDTHEGNIQGIACHPVMCWLNFVFPLHSIHLKRQGIRKMKASRAFLHKTSKINNMQLGYCSAWYELIRPTLLEGLVIRTWHLSETHRYNARVTGIVDLSRKDFKNECKELHTKIVRSKYSTFVSRKLCASRAILFNSSCQSSRQSGRNLKTSRRSWDGECIQPAWNSWTT